MESPWAIRAEGLTRRFGERTAVDNLCLSIPRGTVFGFLGPNGAGKTTTVRLLLGLIRPDAGWVELMGQRMTPQSCAARRSVGALLDRDGLYDRLTAWDNLQFYGEIYRLKPAELRKRAEELLRFCGLWERRHEPVAGWSKGMRQRLGLARALIGNPPLLILDEPTSGLDPATLKSVRELIVSLAASGQHTVFMCTHHLDEVERICNLIGIIREGRLLLQEHPRTLRTRLSRPRAIITVSRLSEEAVAAVGRLPYVQKVESDHERLTVDLTEMEGIEGVVAELVRQDVGVREVIQSTRSLEDVYLELVKGAH